MAMVWFWSIRYVLVDGGRSAELHVRRLFVFGAEIQWKASFRPLHLPLTS